MKKIYIYQGDENRAKIERELKSDIFFVDVYRKAEEILKELVEESKEYKKVTEKVDCENTQYQRMGNNVIAFCAPRGQGKTSALKSFAKYLCNGYGDNNAILDRKIPLENDFVVLDSVDPAALDSGESLVRVVISRIFYLLEKKYTDNHSHFKNNQDKNRLLELFQECYGSIDYLRGKKQEDNGQDDLERLAALGNSARLKMNLIDLIDLFLKIYTDNETQGKEADQKNRFLVVPIDDVDICTTDIYGCCEEIRNYLTLPNVIVLLAVDYAQLHRVIFQKYLQINKEVVHYENKFKSECNKQASEYLLKLLPNNHVIELPEYVSISGREWKELRLVYYKKVESSIGEKYVDILEEDSRICGNLQQQIIKIIYDRTGIILWDDEERFWKFMPQTMRELTQLIKKLVQAPKIDQQKLYQLNSENNPIPDEKQVSDLLNNIHLFKNFFMDNWCMNYMTPMQYAEFEAWIHVLENRKRSGIFNFKLDDMLGERGNDEDENREVKTEYTDGMPPQDVSKDLITMYLTIFLNKWFAEALLDKEQYKKIVDYIDGKGGLLQYPTEHYSENQYNTFYFQIEDSFSEIVSGKDYFLKQFCIEKEGKLYFDFFYPWRFILLNGGVASKSVNGDESSTSTERMEEKIEKKNNLDIRIALKTIISNCSIYCHILKVIKRDVSKEDNKLNWRDIVNNFFYGNVVWLTYLDFLQMRVNNIELLAEHYLKAETPWNAAFILNQNNQKLYLEEFSKKYDKIFGEEVNEGDKINNIIRKLENISSLIYSNVIGNLSLEACKDNEQLKELVLAQQVISSKQTEINELLSQRIKTETDLKKARKLIENIRKEYQKKVKEESRDKDNAPPNS